MDLDHRFPNRGFFGDRQARAMQFVRQENDVGTGIDIHEELARGALVEGDVIGFHPVLDQRQTGLRQ